MIAPPKGGMFKPGDVVVDEIMLKSYTGFKTSLKGLFQNFVIYEDIYSNCMSGSITLIDSMNLVRHFPIIGAEELTIVYKTPFGNDRPVRLKFNTYKISVMVETQQQTTQMVRIEFISPHAIRSMQNKVSRSYRNMPVSRMVDEIYREYLASDMGDYGAAISNDSVPSMVGAIVGSSNYYGQLASGFSDSKQTIQTLAETYDNRSYIIPYWNPLYAINWLCHRARARTNLTYCDYVFFENSDGHHFVPMSDLKTDQPRFKYTNYPAGFRSEDGNRMIEYELRNVFTMTVKDSTDKVKQQTLAMFASTMLTHDLTTKSFNTTAFDYDSKYEKIGSHVEKHRLLPLEKTDYGTATMSSLKYYPSTTYNMAGLEKTADHEETVLYRQSLLAQMNSINLILECHGDTNVKVGQVIEFETFGKESMKRKDDKFEDDYLKGKYLVTAIRHVINDRSHRMTMTISRDSLPEPLADFKKPTLE